MKRDTKKEMESVRIILRVEREGRYFEKELAWRMICALFDLQFMIADETWETIKLNEMDKELDDFFKIIEIVDIAMHGDKIGTYKKGKLVWRKKKDDEYQHGKPDWKKINP
jgi:hypothetical protein